MRLFSTAYILIIILNSHAIFGQIQFDLNPSVQASFMRSVKQFGEFVERFNADFYDVPDLDQDHSLVLDRKQSILYLFNSNDPRLNPLKPEYSTEYQNLILEFVEEVVNERIYINKFSDQINAVVSMIMEFSGVIDTLEITLIQEIDDPNLIRWVILNVHSDLLWIEPRDTSQLRFLSPVSHELGFMELSRALKDPAHLVDYTHKGFGYDPLSVFLFGQANGLFVMQQVIDIGYRIILNNQYQIILEEIPINDKIPAWCITDLMMLGDQ